MFLCVYCCFIGQPHSHPSHPDYIPSVFPAENKLLSHKRSEQDISRWHRRMERLARQAKRQMKETEEEDQERKERLRAEKRRLKKEEKRCQTEERKCQDEEKVREIEQQRIQEEEMHLEMEKQVKLLKEKMGKLEENRDQLKKKTLETQKEWCQVEKYIRQVKKEIHDLESKLECQCDEDEPIFPITVVHTQQQTDETGEMLEKCLKENAQLREKLASQTCGVSMIKENNERTSFYTGLSSWSVFVHVFLFLSPYVVPAVSLTLEDEFFLVLMRLRLGLLMEDLAAHFAVTTTVASRSFQKWLDIMYYRLKFLIMWPSREVIRQNMLPAFKQLYPNCVCIIDCSEIFTDIPTRFEARSIMYSNYKKHNTIKFLIGITPCGSISFLSQCWGGRVSDKVITQESNFLRHLQQDDVVLADRGFTIADDLAIHGAKLEIPAFTRGKSQLKQREVEYSKQLSTVRIHVERVIGQLKKKFKILKGPLPINLLKHKDDTDVSNIDKILHVCAALTNLCGSIV